MVIVMVAQKKKSFFHATRYGMAFLDRMAVYGVGLLYSGGIAIAYTPTYIMLSK